MKLATRLLNTLWEAEKDKPSSRVPAAIEVILSDFQSNMVGILDKKYKSNVAAMWSILNKSNGKDFKKQLKILKNANNEMKLLLNDFGKAKDLSVGDTSKMNKLISDYTKGVAIISDII